MKEWREREMKSAGARVELGFYYNNPATQTGIYGGPDTLLGASPM